MSDLRTVSDQMGRKVTFSTSPKRIISLVPSQTEFLVDVGASVVGRTKFCIHPADRVTQIPIVGGTKNFRMEVIEKLQPDLIIGNKEENYQEGIEELAGKYPVWMSDIASLEDAFEMMDLLGEYCGEKEAADHLLEECRTSIRSVRKSQSGKVLYLIWRDPWMAAGRSTFIDQMLSHLGYQNVAMGDRYPILTNDEIRQLSPEIILLSSEPFPFREKHLEEIKKSFPQSEVRLVDGELYSWYGSRLRHWADHLN